MDGEGDLDEFVERRRVVRRAERARVFGAVERFQRGAGFKNAAAAGTEHVPGHVEEAQTRGVHQGGDHRLFAQSMAGGEGERIDATERSVRRGFNRSLKRIGDSRIGRLPQERPQRLRFSHCACSATARGSGERT
jgi:hypothetical protein